MAMSGHQHLAMTHGGELSNDGSIAGGSAYAAVAAFLAGALSLISLIGFYPKDFAALATMGVGAAILFESGAVARHLSSLTVSPAQRRAAQLISGGVMMQSLAGAAGIALGALALASLHPFTLLGAAALAYGFGAIMGSDALARLSRLLQRDSILHDRAQLHAQEALNATIGIDLLSGVLGVALGALALLGFAPLLLTILAMAVFGGGLLLRGSALPAQTLGAFGY